jgi:ABC-type branched-subunit amino acid transport system substrate-binding protein
VGTPKTIHSITRRHFLTALGALSGGVYWGAGWQLGRPQSDSKNLRVGVNVPMTGFYSGEAYEFSLGAALGAHFINSKNANNVLVQYFPHLSQVGILDRQIELFFADSKCDAKTAQDNAEVLVKKQNVKVLLGSSSSPEALANNTAAQKNGILYLSGIDHSNDCSQLSALGNSIFFDNKTSAKLLVEHLKQDLNNKSHLDVVQIYSEYDWSLHQKQSFSIEFAKQGLEVSARAVAYRKNDSSNIKNLLTSETAEETIIIVNLYGQPLEKFVSEFRASLARKRVIFPLVTDLLREKIDLEGFEDLSYSYFAPNTDKLKMLFQSMEELYEHELNRKATDAAMIGFLQILRYANAVNAVGNTKAAEVQKYLSASNLNSMKDDKSLVCHSLVKITSTRKS